MEDAGGRHRSRRRLKPVNINDNFHTLHQKIQIKKWRIIKFETSADHFLDILERSKHLTQILLIDSKNMNSKIALNKETH